MDREQKTILARIIISAVLLTAGFILPLEGYWRLGYYLIIYGLIGWDILWKAVRNIIRGQVFNENFLMAIASIGAMILGDYPEAILVILLYQIGELFQEYAVGRSRKSIANLMDIRPDYANIQKDGQWVQVDPDDVSVGDVILVKPGEKIPLDGVILEGNANLDTAALTGESLPRGVHEGDEGISGCVNLDGVLKIRVTHEFGESTVAKILDMIENATGKKAKSERFITKFAKVYTPAVVAAAVILAVVPSLITGQWSVWVERALIFLVISCPCALVISVPMSFFGGIGGASKSGILIKGGNFLEALAQAQIVVMDKTGTLTHGVFDVVSIHPDKVSEAQLLEMTALAESYSEHPISLSLKRAYGKSVEMQRIAGFQQVTGKGITARVDGRLIAAGNEELMRTVGIEADLSCGHVHNGTMVYVACDGEYIGHIEIADQIKPDAKKAIADLHALGVEKTVMLTGDKDNVGRAVAGELGIDQVYTQLLPGDKVEKVEELLAQKSPKKSLVFVGDGINDAPVLSRADVGIAMGAMGSDAAIEAADVVLMDDQPSKIALAISIARRTMRIVKQNIVFALAIKAIVMVLGTVGIANMWMAVFADVGVSILAILNASRALRKAK